MDKLDRQLQGRISKRRYLRDYVIFHLFFTPLYIYFILLILQHRIYPYNEIWWPWVAMAVVSFFIAAYFQILTVRRFHDLGRPAKHLWVIFPEVPLSWKYHFWDLLLKEGDSQRNQFGPPPRD